MLGKVLIAALIACLVLIGAGAGLYLANAAPEVPALSAAEAAHSTKPYVVKLHAQWCPVCMLTKAEWAEIKATYAGRVHLFVFDSTNDGSVAASRAEAERLGLAQVLDEYQGASGMVVVLDAQTKQVVAELGGNLAFESYRAAIDAALSNQTPNDG